MSSAKQLNKRLEELFKSHKDDYLTYEELMMEFTKQPTVANSKKVLSLLKEYNVKLISSAEIAKIKNKLEAKEAELERKKIQDSALAENFDLAKEKELLEWSRSDSPVRMYLREMGQVALLTKEEEIEISQQIELGEDIIIDAFCSVPYLIDFILDYKDALLNRERRVKELFKSFDDDLESDDEEEEDEETSEESEQEEKKPKKKGDN